MGRKIPVNRAGWYLIGAGLLIALCGWTAVTLWADKDFLDSGVLASSNPPVADVPDGALSVDDALASCYAPKDPPAQHRVVGGEVAGHWYFACHTTDSVLATPIVIDSAGSKVTDRAVLAAGGLWPEFGVVVGPWGLSIGVGAAAAVLAIGWFYYRKPRPGPPALPPSGRSSWWERRRVAWLLLIPPVSWISLGMTDSISTARKTRLVGQAVFLAVVVAIGYLLLDGLAADDPWARDIYLWALAAAIFARFTGKALLGPDGFNNPDTFCAGLRGRADTATRIQRVGAPPTEMPRGFRVAAILRVLSSALLRWFTFLMLACFLTLTIAFICAAIVSPDISARISIPQLLTTSAIYYLCCAMVIPGAITALLSLPLILGWKDPPRILVLRRFHRSDRSRSLRRVIRRQVAGFGHIYTFADAAIRTRWYVRVPVLLGEVSVLTFRSRRLGAESDLMYLRRVIRNTGPRNMNWAISRSKIFALRSADTLWHTSVEQILPECDVVLIDLTYRTENLDAEMALVRQSQRVTDCIFLAANGKEDQAAQIAQNVLGYKVFVYGYDRRGRLTNPRQFRQNLFEVTRRANYRSPPGQRSAASTLGTAAARPEVHASGALARRTYVR